MFASWQVHGKQIRKTIHHFFNVFEQTFFSYDLNKTKKDPDTFLEVLDTMSLSPSQCLFIDDSIKNISIAKSVGIEGIHFIGAQQLEMELKNRQVWC